MDLFPSLLLLVVCLIFAAFPAITGQDPTEQTEVERCCIEHDQFTIDRYTSIGLVQEAIAYKGHIQILEEHKQAYDYINNRAASHITAEFINRPNWPSRATHIVEDFTTDIVFFINYSLQTCENSTSDSYASQHFSRCISDTAVLLRASHFGDKAHFGETWLIPEEHSLSNLKGFASFTIGNDCIRFTDTAVGEVDTWNLGKQQIVSSGLWENFTVGIANPDYYFTVPDWCYEYLEQQEQQQQEEPTEEPTEAPEPENGGSSVVVFLPLLLMLTTIVLNLNGF